MPHGDEQMPGYVAPTSEALLPRPVRRGVYVVLGALVVGAAYLAAVRGPAILLDLSGMAALICG